MILFNSFMLIRTNQLQAPRPALHTHRSLGHTNNGVLYICTSFCGLLSMLEHYHTVRYLYITLRSIA
jgi:hypothetical protein